MTVVRFQAAQPVGVNGMYRPGVVVGRGGRRHMRLIKTDAGAAFCFRLLAAAKAAWRVLRQPAMGGDERHRVPVGVSMWLAFDSYGSDLDGPIKPVLDSLQASGIVWNDNRVDELHVYRLPPDEAFPRVEVAVQELEVDPA